MNRIVRRTILAMLLIVVVVAIWNCWVAEQRTLKDWRKRRGIDD
jgi:hypothetical protein